MTTRVVRRGWQWVAVAAVIGVAACGSERPAPSSPSDPASAVASPTLSPTPEPSPSVSADCATSTVARMSRAERVGQLLMVGTSVNAPSGIGDTVARYRLGGVFLQGRSSRPAAALRADIAGLQSRAAMPLLVSLDQEGGDVQTLKGPDFPLVPSARRLGAQPAATIREVVGDDAQRLAGIGVRLNLAPVADTVPAALGRDNPPIGAFNRQYGSDPAAVAADVRVAVAASQGAGVLTVLKHFPGLGRVRFNTDTSTKAIDETATADDPYLKPFAAGIEAGSAGVMISSASYPLLDRTTVAAFSRPIITGLLRGRFGFRGLIMSDDLGAGVAVSRYSPGERAVRFVGAGGDLALTIQASDAAPMTDALTEEADKDATFAARVDDAARNVVRAKLRAGVYSCSS